MAPDDPNGAARARGGRTRALPRPGRTARRAARRALDTVNQRFPPAAVPASPVTSPVSLQAQNTALRARAETLARQRDELRATVRSLRAYRTAVSRKLGVEPTPDAADHERRTVVDELRRQAVDGGLTQALREGRDLDTALVETVRSLLSVDQHVRARSLAQALLRQSATQVAGHVGVALVAHFQTLQDLASDRFAQVPEEVALRLAPVEYLDVGFAEDPARAGVLALSHWDELTPSTRMAVVRFSFRSGRTDASLDLLARLDADGSAAALVGRDLADHDWLLEWQRLREEAHERLERTEPAAVTIGVMDYKQPDLLRQSSNLGDHIQTLGALGHLLAFPTELTGDPELVGVLEELRGRLRTERRHEDSPGPPARVVTVNRDATPHDAIPPGTWLVAFGWYMHTTFGGPYAFPFDERLHPVFVSFHVQRRQMLTPEAVEYLRGHGPIGCRDWTTTYLLLNLGVDAFFSGCLTTTVDAFFPDRPATGREHARRAYVDSAPDPDDDTAHVFTHAEEHVSRAPLAQNLRAAVELVERYRDHESVVTSRLHCYLPATAVGCTVDFRPRRLSDVRFDGLLGMAPGSPELEAVQDRLRTVLATLYRTILAGEPAEEVYAQWRALTADQVREARQRLAREVAPLASGVDPHAAAAQILADRIEHNHDAVSGKDDVVHVALAADQNLRAEVPVVVESIVSTTTRPVHVTLLARGYSREQHRDLAAVFPGTAFTVLPCDTVDHGDIAGMLKHITVSTMDRLLLPLLLPDVAKVVYHDIDAVTMADLGELFDTDLAGLPLAARSARASWAESGFANVYRAAARLPPDEAFELRRRMFKELPYDFVAFNAGIMVLDLARMRGDDFCRRFVPFAEHYGMNDQEILNCYAGPRRTVLDPRWNAVPQQETVLDPRIIHWAGPAKPWSRDHVIFQDTWDRYVDQVSARAQSRGVALPRRATAAR